MDKILDQVYSLWWLIGLAIIMVVGRYHDYFHYKTIFSREDASKEFPVFNQPLPTLANKAHRTEFICASVAVADDFFKRLWASLRSLWGGRVIPQEIVIDRARREALLSLKAKCPNAKALVNVQLCNCTINRRVVGIIAYGTAVYTTSRGA